MPFAPTTQLFGTISASSSSTLGTPPTSPYACQFDELLVGFGGSMSPDQSRITSLRTLCQRVDADAIAVDRLRLVEPAMQSAALAGTAGAVPFAFRCPAHHVVTGVRARVTGTTFGELRFDCSPLSTSRTTPVVVSAILPRLTVAGIGVGTGTLGVSLCPAGSVATGFAAAAASQIDGLALRCGTPRVSIPARGAIASSSIAAPSGGVGTETTFECPAGTMVDGLEVYSLPPSTTFTGVRARCRTMSALYSDAGDFVIAQRGAVTNGTMLGTLPIGARIDVLSCPLDQALTLVTARGTAAGINALLGTCVVPRIPHNGGAGRTTAGNPSNTVGVVMGNTSAALCPANQVAVGITARVNGGSLTGLGFRCAPHSGT